jgi:hypothetical protein
MGDEINSPAASSARLQNEQCGFFERAFPNTI